ncbi:MAG: hypothetical protein JW795_02370 [Chitinivibrionales bacterium]|nr:hypothetical protein [Chitinivibrionales bacterium]
MEHGRHITYSSSGVDYLKIDPVKLSAQKAARETANHLVANGFPEVPQSRGESAYVMDMGDYYLASITECLGTKSLIADAYAPLTKKTYYDLLAQDTIAMAINDIITVGSRPLSIHAYWACGSSEMFSHQRMLDLIEGWKNGCDRAQVSWAGGETPCLSGIITPGCIDLAASCVGIIKPKSRLSLGDALRPGDAILFAEASGIHANGISMARNLVSHLPQAYATLLSDGSSFGESLLVPTPLYSVLTEALHGGGVPIHYCSNITGHGWRKIMRHTKEFTYRIQQIPTVPEVLRFIVQEAGMSPQQAYGTFNMGAGFALFVPQESITTAMEISKLCGFPLLQAGVVEEGPKQVIIEPLGIVYSADTLAVRL